MDDLVDPGGSNNGVHVGIDFDRPVGVALLVHIVATAGRIWFGSLVFGSDHFEAGVAGHVRHADLRNVVFRDGDCLVPVLLVLVWYMQSDSVPDNLVYFAYWSISAEAVHRTDWTWCIVVGFVPHFFRTHYQMLTLPVPTNLRSSFTDVGGRSASRWPISIVAYLCSSRLLIALQQMPLSQLDHVLGPWLL